MANPIYVAVDVETTGFDASREAIIEVAAVTFQGQDILDEFSTLIYPQRDIPAEITRLTGITDAMVEDAPTISMVRALAAAIHPGQTTRSSATTSVLISRFLNRGAAGNWQPAHRHINTGFDLDSRSGSLWPGGAGRFPATCPFLVGDRCIVLAKMRN